MRKRRGSVWVGLVTALLGLVVAGPAVAADGDNGVGSDKKGEVSPERVAKLSANDSVSFLRTRTEIRRGLPLNADVVLNLVDHDDPLMRASLRRSLADERGVELLATLETDARQVARGSGDGQDSEADEGDDSKRRARMLELNSNNAVANDAETHDWPAPEYLLAFELIGDAHDPTVWSTSDSSQPIEPEGADDRVCLAAQTVSTADGTVVDQSVRCGTAKSIFGSLKPLIQVALGDRCDRGPLVVPLPPRLHGSAERTSAVVKRTIVEGVSEAGCRIQDVPGRTPGASKSGRDDSSESGYPQMGWRYHTRFFSTAHPAVFEEWKDGRVAVNVEHDQVKMTAEQLRAFLEDYPDAKWVDPDLKRMSSSKKVSFERFSVEAVDVESGELRVSGTLFAGAGTPRDVVADAMVDLVTDSDERGWLEVHRIPRQAGLKVDGRTVKSKGDTPRLLELEPGEHRLELIIDGKTEMTRTVDVRPMTYGVVGLVTPFAQLTVTVPSACEGAVVFVDGKKWGPAPVEDKKVTATDHEIVIQKEGIKEPVSREVDVLAGSEKSVRMKPNGWLRVEPAPEEANVYIDGERLGTGVQEPEVAQGGREVTIKLDGYPTKTRQRVLVPSCETRKTAPALDGKLVAHSDPDGADLRVEGQSVGSTSTSTYRKAGAYDSRCVWCGYGESSETMQLEPGRTDEHDFTLDPPGVQLEIGVDMGVGLLGGGKSLSSNAKAPKGMVGGKIGGWFAGRFGVMARVSNYKDEGLNLGGYLQTRLLVPGPGWNLPLGVGFEYGFPTYPADGEDAHRMSPMAHVGLRKCLGGRMTAGGHLYMGYDIGHSNPEAGLMVDLTFLSGPAW